MNTAIIRLCLVLFLGTSIGFYLELPFKMAFLALLFGLLLFVVGYFRAKKILFPDAFFGSCTFLLFFILGIFVTTLNLPQNQPRHYLNLISSEEFPLLQLRIKESLKPDLYNHKFIAEVVSVNDRGTHGKVLLLHPKDSLKMPFLEGKELLISAPPEVIPAPLNPHQFDYAEFMSRKEVYRQINLRNGVYRQVSDESSDLKTAAAKLRKQITTALQKRNFGAEELPIVQALLLGQKQDISAETYNNFAAAGAVHILAVSGLHVGIILLILNWLFSPFDRLKKSKFLKTLLVILCLWGFAVLAGLSPSVVRAVTMFSFVAVGMQIKRRTGTLNSVFLSLMLLLLIKPQWIFEVGFQLSYAAVISIVLLRPLLLELWEPSNRTGKYFWDLLTVTIAAQMGVLPLSLYYFHQFPGLFFLSNLIILPFLGIILILGVLVLILALAGLLPSFFVKAYEFIISVLNSTVEVIASQEKFLFRDITFSLPEVWAWYLIIFLTFLLLKNFSYRKLLAVLSSVIIIQTVYIVQQVKTKEELIVFHRSRNSMIGKTEENNLQLYHNSSGMVEELAMIKNYKVGEGISEVEQKTLQNIYLQKGHFLILLDSTGILPQQIPQQNHLLLSNSPKINLVRVLERVKPSAIIADGSNYRSMVAKWQKTAREHQIPFHYTAEKGAFRLK
ncbi:MAG: ComEC/Rec2 family competence protein [Salinimicrobium sediminis]|nr:ComEC/Rec2 family competence protein [Salinimicrobium sediminis]